MRRGRGGEPPSTALLLSLSVSVRRGAEGVDGWVNARPIVEVRQQARRSYLNQLVSLPPAHPPLALAWPQNYSSLAQVYSRLNLVVKVTRDPTFFVCERRCGSDQCSSGGADMLTAPLLTAAGAPPRHSQRASESTSRSSVSRLAEERGDVPLLALNAAPPAPGGCSPAVLMARPSSPSSSPANSPRGKSVAGCV